MNSKNILKKSCLQECAKKWVAITAGSLLSRYYFRFVLDSFVVDWWFIRLRIHCLHSKTKSVFSKVGKSGLRFQEKSFIVFLGFFNLHNFLYILFRIFKWLAFCRSVNLSQPSCIVGQIMPANYYALPQIFITSKWKVVLFPSSPPGMYLGDQKREHK